jgi:hypothetical protein
MSDTFTYIIRSQNKTVTTDKTNNCSIQLGPLPSRYQEFECEVVGFYISTKDCIFNAGVSMIELRSDIPLSNGMDTYGNNLRTLAICDLNSNNTTGTHSFRCGNFNRLAPKFTLYDDSNNLLQTDFYNVAGFDDFDRPWILVLKMRGVTKINSPLK